MPSEYRKRLTGRIGGVPEEDFDFEHDDGSHDFVIVMDDKRLISNSGLALVGKLLQLTDLPRKLKSLQKPKSVKHGHYECVSSYIGLLCQGKTAYEDVREMLEDTSFYCRALKINTIPSPETLRQRMDYLGAELFSSSMLENANVQMLNRSDVDISACFSGHFPLDIDVSVHDNSQSNAPRVARVRVERTYMGIDGYAPIYAYLGREGYMVKAELRPGSDHSQNPKTVPFLQQSIDLAKQVLPKRPILVRMDSGNDSKGNIAICMEAGVDFLIKRNLRRESLEDWLFTAQFEADEAANPREGKQVYTGSELRDIGLANPIRVVFQVSVRTIDKKGQVLLAPDIEANTWWTSLDLPEEDVIQLYKEHGTCEQFHSEVKSDIGLERFPSGIFTTNGAILKLTMLAYNTLRIIGQTALLPTGVSNRHEVERLRIKTVMQRLVYIASHITKHARRHFLNLGRSNMWRGLFQELYISLA